MDMKEKLTLTINQETKERAKKFAKQNGVSISSLVEEYLDRISSGKNVSLSGFGKNPVKTGVQDGSVNHDRYLYTTD